MSTSPLARLPLVDRRLTSRGALDDPLERAAELKAAPAESIGRLKPRSDEAFGTSDEWRYFNALYFPYVAGLKPYSRRGRAIPDDPARRKAFEWLRDQVPERTLHNWQSIGARLVAEDLLTRGGRDA